jgi:hypothetical protein
MAKKGKKIIYIDENEVEINFDKLTDDQLIKEAQQFVKQVDLYKSQPDKSKTIKELQAKMQMLRIHAQRRFSQLPENEGNIYPDVGSVNFQSKIIRKQEFAKSLYKSLKDESSTFDESVNNMCDTNRNFMLTQNQIFLKNFIAPQTPYNSVLLFHGVGVGKTCTAISIAENFRQTYAKKVLVILPTLLKDGFKKQLFDINKVMNGDTYGTGQCVAARYLNQISDRESLGKDILDKRVNKLINDNYEFLGFLEFANIISKAELDINRLYKDETTRETKLTQQIRDRFSNRVIIVDEVHNTRSEGDGDKSQKVVPPFLKKVLQVSENVKLVLSTATPMFNSATEIIWILNLLLANEKRPLLEEKKIFTNDVLLEDGKDKLLQATEGLVSFMRGENPFTFPIRLYPSINRDKSLIPFKNMPSIDIYGIEIPNEKRIKTIEIIQSVMGAEQSSVVLTAMGDFETINPDNADTGIDDDPLDADDEPTNKPTSGKKGHHISKPIQLSNIVYPSEKSKYGKSGFESCFEKIPAKNLRLKYSASVLQTSGQFLNLDKVGNYSAKIKTIVDYILNSKGIVFVYSYFIYGALLPLAIALEHVGFQKYGSENIMADVKVAPLKINNQQNATYSFLVRDLSICADMSKDIEMITSAANKNGEVVKVILGTSVSAEGIDFKCVREVHMFEPWYHLNKVEQIIGRAVRTCSHIKLPKEERNVTIYHHAATPQKKTNQECIDLRIYRIAENKQTTIWEVEKILKENAIDCILNRSVSFFDQETLNVTIDLQTSQGLTINNFSIGDTNTSLRFKQIHCASKLKQTDLGVNTSTFRIEHYIDDIGLYVEYIRLLFKDYVTSYSFDQILETLRKLVSRFDIDILKYALTELLEQKTQLKNQNGLTGILGYIGDRYMFLPVDNPFSYVTTINRNEYKTLTSKRIKLEADTLNEITSKHKSVPKADKSTNVANTKYDILQKINDDYHAFLKELNNNQYMDDFSQYVIDFIIDRLSEADILNVCRVIVGPDVKINSSIKDFITQVRKSLVDGGYLVPVKNTSDRFFIRTAYNDKIHVLSKINENYNVSNAAAIEQIEFKKLPDSILSKVFDEQNGFLQVVKDEVLFKIIGDKDNSNGCVCEKTSTVRVDDLKKKISAWHQNILDEQAYKKKQLCMLYEITLRASPDSFLRPISTLKIVRKKKVLKASDDKKPKKK